MSLLDETYGGVSGYVLFWGLCLVAGFLFLRRTACLYRCLLLGRKIVGPGSLLRSLLAVLADFIVQMPHFRSITKRDQSGLGHVFMAWGFFIFAGYYFFFIVLATGAGIDGLLRTQFFYYYAWIIDIAALFVIVAAIWGLVRRYIVIPNRLKGEQTLEAMFILVTVLIHPVTHIFKQATGIALGYPPFGLRIIMPPISGAISMMLGTNSNLLHSAYAIFFWVHWCVVLFVLIFIPYTRYLHVITLPFNIFLGKRRQKYVIQPIDFSSGQRLGVSRVHDFSRAQLLDLCSCVVCGRCQDACPAFATGKPLNPKTVIKNLYRKLLESTPRLLSSGINEDEILNNVVVADELLSCTTCGACIEACPALINQVDKVIDLRRMRVYEGKFDHGHETSLKRVSQQHNPWGLPQNRRTKGLGMDVACQDQHYDCIYWIGCAAAFDETARQIALSTAQILRSAGMKYGVLGAEEKCCGDFVRRLGDEGLFQNLAKENIRMLNGFDFGFVLTHCPHCYHIFRNEYPQFGNEFPVMHHTQLINRLLEEERIRMHTAAERVLYHDPCYLGRYNDVYEAPRKIIKNINESIHEFPRSRNKSFCCGAGGGHMWLEKEQGTRISVARTREAVEQNPHVIVTACPFCYLMLDEAVQLEDVGDIVRVADIAMIVEQAHY